MFDTIIIALAVLAFVNGAFKGLVREIASLAATLLGVYGAARFSPLTEELISPYLGSVPTRLIAFAVTLFVIVFCVHLLARFITRIITWISLSWLNRILGGVAGVLKVLFVVSCIIGLVERFLPSDTIYSEEEKDEMLTYRFVQGFSSFIFPYIDEGLDAVGEIKKQIDDVAPGGDTTI